ncbi:NUDIX hydrolase [Geobacillus thermoleovorans]
MISEAKRSSLPLNWQAAFVCLEISFISREIYYQIMIQSDTALSTEQMTKNEKDTLKGLKWWSKDELQKINDFAPRDSHFAP